MSPDVIAVANHLLSHFHELKLGLVVRQSQEAYTIRAVEPGLMTYFACLVVSFVQSPSHVLAAISSSSGLWPSLMPRKSSTRSYYASILFSRARTLTRLHPVGAYIGTPTILCEWGAARRPGNVPRSQVETKPSSARRGCQRIAPCALHQSCASALTRCVLQIGAREPHARVEILRDCIRVEDWIHGGN